MLSEISHYFSTLLSFVLAPFSDQLCFNNSKLATNIAKLLFHSFPIPVEENLPKVAAKLFLASDWSSQSHVTCLKLITKTKLLLYCHWQGLHPSVSWLRSVGVVRGFPKENQSDITRSRNGSWAGITTDGRRDSTRGFTCQCSLHALACIDVIISVFPLAWTSWSFKPRTGTW